MENKIRELVDKTTQFFKETEIERKRVSWPPLKDTVRSTGAVIFIAILLASFLGLIDFVFSLIVKLVLS